MLDEFVGLGDVVEREARCYIEALPAGFECPIDVARGFTLCLGRNIVAADKGQSGVDEDELPDGELSRRSVGGVGGDRSALRQHLDIGLDVGRKGHFNDVIDDASSYLADVFYKISVSEEDFVRAGARSEVLIALGAAGGDHMRSCPMRELNSTRTNGSRATLNEYSSPCDRSRNMNGAMGGYAGNSQAGALFHRHTFRQRSHLLQRDNDIFGRGAEGTVGLRPETPYATSQPFLRDSLADDINSSRAIAVRNDTRIGHADAESVLALLYVAGIDARCCNTNSNFTCNGIWVVHHTDDQNVTSRTLFLVPCGFHSVCTLAIEWRG